MGASQFGNYEHGKTAEQAFHVAAEADRHENGHSYSGGIGMKDGFTMLPELPARWTTQTLESLISQAEFGEEYKAANGQWKTRKGSAEKAQRKLNEWLYSAPQHGYIRNADALVQAYADKWGSALAVVVPEPEAKRYRHGSPKPRGQRLFYFFGMASS